MNLHWILHLQISVLGRSRGPARAKNVTQPASQSRWTFLFGLNDYRRQDLFNRKENLSSTKLLQPAAVHPQELLDVSCFAFRPLCIIPRVPQFVTSRSRYLACSGSPPPSGVTLQEPFFLHHRCSFQCQSSLDAGRQFDSSSSTHRLDESNYLRHQ